MRTVLIYSLVTFYFLISIRLTANVHYCGGKIRTVSLLGFGKQKSCCSGKAMKRSCCKDVQICLKKASEDQRFSQIPAQFAVVETVSPQWVKAAVEVQHYVPLRIVPSVHAPPPEAFPPVFLKNCVFLI